MSGMDDLREEFLKETPEEARLFVLAFALYISTEFSENKLGAWEFCHGFTNAMTNDRERELLTDQLIKAHIRVARRGE